MLYADVEREIPLIEDMIAIALTAGQTILPIYRTGCSSSIKADGSPVTLADERGEEIILRELGGLFPGFPVVAEEAATAGRIPYIDSKFFLVDPLDGTKEFISGSGDFTINIALVEDGVPVLGVVYAPALGQIYAGSRGQGARLGKVTDGAIEEWRTISVCRPSKDGLVVVASKSHLTAETSEFVARFPVRQFISAGSSLKFCQVASGVADLYPRLGRTMEWDTAAADAVLRAAGGSVRRMNGEVLCYGKRNQAEDCDFANPWFVASGPFDPFKLTDGKPMTS
jgi:3'(2'),5'-bisphosphate nucleotidase